MITSSVSSDSGLAPFDDVIPYIGDTLRSDDGDWRRPRVDRFRGDTDWRGDLLRRRFRPDAAAAPGDSRLRGVPALVDEPERRDFDAALAPRDVDATGCESDPDHVSLAMMSLGQLGIGRSPTMSSL